MSGRSPTRRRLAGHAEPASVIREDVLAMSAYQVPDAIGMLKLDAMENPFPLPAALAGGLGHMLAGVPLNRYPLPDYARLESRLREAMRVPASAALMLGNGSDELISIIAQATARPGATVLSPWPSFVMFEMSARLAGSRFVGVPLTADFALDRGAMLAAIDRERPAVVFLAYPNNPTGNCFDPAVIDEILAAAPGLVVIDEAYQPFAQHSFMARAGESSNLLVMRTMSKLGLAGLRLGYLAGAEPWIEQFDKVRPPYNVNVLTEAAALYLLDHLDLFDAQARELREQRARLIEALRLRAGIRVYESRANFLLMRLTAGHGCGPAVWRALRERRVLVKDVSRMHPMLADCLRVTVGSADENAQFLDALDRALADCPAPSSGAPDPDRANRS